MAVSRFLQLVNGLIQMAVPATSSSGAATAGQIVALNAAGLVDQTMVGGLYTLTYASSLAVNWGNGKCQVVTLTGNPTLTFSGAGAGQHYLLELTQDATGSRTVTWPTIRWQGGSAPTLTTTANKTDLVVLIYDGTNWFGQAALNF